jgi:hypothetical protein
MQIEYSLSGYVTNERSLQEWRDTIAQSDSIAPKPCVAFLFSRTSSSDRFQARIGGLPAWEESKPWPMCKTCDEPLAFVAQFDFRTSTIQRSLPGDVLLLHYCFDCHPWRTVDGQATLTWQRVVPNSALITDRIIPQSLEDDDPGPAYGDPVVLDDFLPRTLTLPATMKIGGHPIPIQNAEAPLDSLGRRMRFLCAIGGLNHGDVPKRGRRSEPVGDLVWGDAGCINIWKGLGKTACELAWEMECY